MKKHDNQLIFVTCADANNVILQESKLTVSLAGGLKIQDQHNNKIDNTDHNNTQNNHDSYSSSSDNNNQNAGSENNSSNVSDKSNNSVIDKGSKTQSAHNNANNSSNNSNSNINDDSHSSSQVAKRKHFVSVLSATGVGMTCIVLVAAIAAFVGMSMRLNVNGAHAKKEK